MDVLWKVPFPSTMLPEVPTFELVGAPMEYQLKFGFEDEDDKQMRCTINFLGVQSFKYTHFRAVSAFQYGAYLKLVSVGSDWLRDILNLLGSLEVDTSDMKHLMFTFDDGPCIELICTGFAVEIQPMT